MAAQAQQTPSVSQNKQTKNIIVGKNTTTIFFTLPDFGVVLRVQTHLKVFNI